MLDITFVESQNVEDNHNALGIMITNQSIDNFQQNLPKEIKAIYYRDIEVAALTDHSNVVARGLQSISQQELLQQPLIAYAPKGIESSLVYQLIKPYGEPEIKYVVENSALFLSLMKTGKYYSIGERNVLQDKGLLQIPFKEPVLLSIVFLLQEDALKSFSIKSFINLLLTKVGRPVLN